jgi:hypothetical protein
MQVALAAALEAAVPPRVHALSAQHWPAVVQPELAVQAVAVLAAGALKQLKVYEAVPGLKFRVLNSAGTQ